jgi:hypothetical protein
VLSCIHDFLVHRLHLILLDKFIKVLSSFRSDERAI